MFSNAYMTLLPAGTTAKYFIWRLSTSLTTERLYSLSPATGNKHVYEAAAADENPPFRSPLDDCYKNAVVLALRQETFAFTLANWTGFKPSRTSDSVIALHPPEKPKPKTLHVAAFSAHTGEPEWRRAARAEAGKIEMWLRAWVRNL